MDDASLNTAGSRFEGIDPDIPADIYAASIVDKPTYLLLGRRRIVAGLLWQVTDSPAQAVTDGIQYTKDNRTAFDLFAARRNFPQYVLASRENDLRAGDLVGADHIAAVLGEDDFVCLIELEPEDTYWYVQVSQGQVLPGDGDRIFTSAEVAAKAFAAARLDNPNQIFFAPTGWFDGIQPFDMQALAKSTGIRLRDPERARKLIPKIVGWGLVIAVLSVGGFMGKSYLDEQEAERLAAEKAARQAEVRAMLEQKKKVQQVQTPAFHKAYRVADIVRNCTSAINQTPVFVAGFDISQIVCDQGLSVQASYQRLPGASITWFQAGWNETGWARPSLDASGNTVVIGRTLAQTLPEIGAQTILNEHQVRARLMAMAQDTADVSAIKIGSRLDPQPPDAASAKTWDKPDYAWFEFELATSIIGDWSSLLSRTPGVFLKRIVWDHKAAAYILEGEIYVQ